MNNLDFDVKEYIQNKKRQIDLEETPFVGGKFGEEIKKFPFPVDEEWLSNYIKQKRTEIRTEKYGVIRPLTRTERVMARLKKIPKILAGPLYPEKGIAPLTAPSEIAEDIKKAFGPPRKEIIRYEYDPDLGKKIPVHKIITPLGTKIINEIKSQWETDWPNWVGLGIGLATVGAIQLPTIQSHFISKSASKFAQNNLPALKKKFPDFIKTIEDAQSYGELALKGYFNEIAKSKYWMDLNPASQLSIVKKLCGQIEKIALSSPKIIGALPAPQVQAMQTASTLTKTIPVTIEMALKQVNISPDIQTQIATQFRQIGKADIKGIIGAWLTGLEDYQWLSTKEQKETYNRLVNDTEKAIAKIKVKPEVKPKETGIKTPQEEWKDFQDKIIEFGGVKPYGDFTASEKKTVEWEEFNETFPLRVRRKGGMAPDELATLMGFRNDEAMMEHARNLQFKAREYGKKYPAMGLSMEKVSPEQGTVPPLPGGTIEENIIPKVSIWKNIGDKTVGAFDKVASIFSTQYPFMRRGEMETYQKFRTFFASHELDIKEAFQEVKSIFEGTAKEERIALAYHQEDPNRYPIPEGLKDIAKKQTAMYEFCDELLKMAGVYEEGFPDARITQIERKIKILRQEISSLKLEEAKKKRREEIGFLMEELDLLKELRYLPHQYQGTIQSNITKLLPQSVMSNNKFRATFRRIKGRKLDSLTIAKELGLIPEEDAANIMSHYLVYTKNELRKFYFVEELKRDTDLILPEKEAPADWVKVAIPQLKGYKVDSLIADFMEDISGTWDRRGGLTRAWDEFCRVGKFLKFYKPMIMVFNNLPQAYWAGGTRAALDPTIWRQSIKHIVNQDEFYKRCIQEDLFPSPRDIRPYTDEMLDMWAELIDRDTPKVAKALYKVSDGKWKMTGKGGTKAIIDSVQGLYNTLWHVTWSMDRIQRMNTVTRLMRKGMSFEDAIGKARFFHVDYADLPDKTRRAMNAILLTPTYRTGVLKVYGACLTHPKEHAGDIARMLAFWATLGLIGAVSHYNYQERYRLVKKEKGKEKVITIPGPLMELQKYLARGPKGSARLYSSVPVHVMMALWDNRDWKGDKIWWEGDPETKQKSDTAFYILRTYFAPLEEIRNLNIEESNLKQDLLRFAGISAYEREPSERWVRYNIRQAKSDYRALRYKKPALTPEERERALEYARKRVEQAKKSTQPSIWQKGWETLSELLLP